MLLSFITLFAVLSKLTAALPCDIYNAAGTPCVAAHATTRALYSCYNGPLYQLTRGSDNTTTDVFPLAPGGVANAATQDNFCNRAVCVISKIYDQSGLGNHLGAAGGGGAAGGPIPIGPRGTDFFAGATGAVVRVGGQKAFGVFTTYGTGYRNDNTIGVATGTQPEGMYAVLDGTHYNDKCCFDYGNAETNNLDTGAGTMEAIYFGGLIGTVHGPVNGPWLQADLENGLFGGGAANDPSGLNPNNPSVTDRFFTAVLKGNDTNLFSLRGGDATTSSLSTFYAGPRPDGYFPMNKPGAIILGVGGDNSLTAQGTFYEGAMTRDYPDDATENAVQADIAAAGYIVSAETISGDAVEMNSIITFQNAANNDYLAVNGNNVLATSNATSNATNFRVVPPLQSAAYNCFSFESIASPGTYLRHYAYQLFSDDPNNTSRSPSTIGDDGTFCSETGFQSSGAEEWDFNSFRSYSYPTRYWRTLDNGNVFIGTQGGPFQQDSWENFNGQASWRTGLVSKN